MSRPVSHGNSDRGSRGRHQIWLALICDSRGPPDARERRVADPIPAWTKRDKCRLYSAVRQRERAIASGRGDVPGRVDARVRARADRHLGAP